MPSDELFIVLMIKNTEPMRNLFFLLFLKYGSSKVLLGFIDKEGFLARKKRFYL